VPVKRIKFVLENDSFQYFLEYKMCGRFVCIIPPEELVKIFALVETPLVEPRYNVAPSQQVSVVRSAGDHNILAPLKWGLVPSWSKDPSIGSHMINARSETIAEKPSFRQAIKYNRCIIPTSGFYEWKAESGKKQPYYIHMANGSPMCFAGIWETWTAPDSSVIETFSILTTTSNKIIEPLHDRMPVILSPENYPIWLNQNMHDSHQLERLYQQYPSEQMTAYKVPDLVNNPKFDSPACIAKV